MRNFATRHNDQRKVPRLGGSKIESLDGERYTLAAARDEAEDFYRLAHRKTRPQSIERLRQDIGIDPQTLGEMLIRAISPEDKRKLKRSLWFRGQVLRYFDAMCAPTEVVHRA